MAVYNNLKAIRRLTNSSLTSIIDITNLNFRSLSDANLEFLTNIGYDEALNSFTLYQGTFDFVNITDTLSLKLDGIPTFTIDSLGRAEGQELLVKVAETKRLRMTDFPDWPNIGVPGEIIYTGIQNQRPEFGEDFIGYLQGRGWVSLTDSQGTGYLILTLLEGSPPVPPCPGVNKATIWVGPPGYATGSVPTTQTIYFTDENCDVYDLMSGGGGGGGGSCGYFVIENFTANVPQTINHNLNTQNVQVQTIRTDTGELVEGFVNNYLSNSVDITFSQTISAVRVVVISAECGGGGGGAIEVLQDGTQVVAAATAINFVGPGITATNAGSGQANVSINQGNKKYISPTETLTIDADYQYTIYGNFTVEGVVNNSGEVVIMNGTLSILPGGQFNNLGAGTLTIVNLATGDSFLGAVKTFTSTALVPVNVSHNLGTSDFVFNAYDGGTLIDIDYTIVDINTIQVTTTGNVGGGAIIFQAKI
jgi:hypothetical protein